MLAFDDQVLRHPNLHWATAETHGGMMDARPPAFQAVCMAPSGNLDWIRVRVKNAARLDEFEKMSASTWQGFTHGPHAGSSLDRF